MANIELPGSLFPPLVKLRETQCWGVKDTRQRGIGTAKRRKRKRYRWRLIKSARKAGIEGIGVRARGAGEDIKKRKSERVRGLLRREREREGGRGGVEGTKRA